MAGVNILLIFNASISLLYWGSGLILTVTKMGHKNKQGLIVCNCMQVHFSHTNTFAKNPSDHQFTMQFDLEDIPHTNPLDNSSLLLLKFFQKPRHCVTTMSLDMLCQQISIVVIPRLLLGPQLHWGEFLHLTVPVCGLGSVYWQCETLKAVMSFKVQAQDSRFKIVSAAFAVVTYSH